MCCCCSVGNVCVVRSSGSFLEGVHSYEFGSRCGRGPCGAHLSGRVVVVMTDRWIVFDVLWGGSR